MKRLILVTALLVLTVSATGCRHGRWRLRGAKCRPGMSMPTYTQPQGQAPPGAPCNSGYPPPGYSQSSGYSQTSGYMPANPGYMPGGYPPNSGYVQGGTGISTGNVVVQEFPTTPIDSQTHVMQRPFVTSPGITSVESGTGFTVPGPEMGPLPNG